MQSHVQLWNVDCARGLRRKGLGNTIHFIVDVEGGIRMSPHIAFWLGFLIGVLYTAIAAIVGVIQAAEDLKEDRDLK